MAENESDSVKGEHDAQAADKARDVCFICWLRTSCQYAVEQAEKYNYEYDKHRNGPCPIRDWPAQIAANPRLLLAVVLSAATALFASLYTLGFFRDSNSSIATFTAILIVVGIIQWWTTRRQWQAMRAANEEFVKQNEIMIRQNKTMAEQTRLARRQLKHAEAASKQTDAAIEQMRLEQRAWLFVEEMTLGRLDKGITLLIHIPIKNSGHTPAEVVAGKIRSYIRPSSQDHKTLIEEFDKEQSSLYDSYIVPPRNKLRLVIGHPGTMTEDDIYDITCGIQNVYVLGRLRYYDAMRNIHTAKFFYAYSTFDGFCLQPGYGSMD